MLPRLFLARGIRFLITSSPLLQDEPVGQVIGIY